MRIPHLCGNGVLTGAPSLTAGTWGSVTHAWSGGSDRDECAESSLGRHEESCGPSLWSKHGWTGPIPASAP